MKTSISLALRSRGDPRLMLGPAKRAEEAGFHRIWLVEVYEADVLVLAAALAKSTTRIGLASGVVNSYLRLPFLLAMGAATVSDLSGGRFLLGVGSGAPPMGYSSESPSGSALTRLQETVQIVRRLLAGESVTYEGKLFRASNLKLGASPRHKVMVYSAGMGLGTVRLASRFSDGVVLMIPTHRFLREARSVIKESLADRKDMPGSFPVACHLLTSVSRDRKEAETNAGRALASYMTIPVYEASFRRLGFGTILDDVLPLAKKSVDAAGLIIPKEMVDELVIHGTPEDCIENTKRWMAEGISEPVLYPCGSKKLQFPKDVERMVSLLSGQLRKISS